MSNMKKKLPSKTPCHLLSDFTIGIQDRKTVSTECKHNNSRSPDLYIAGVL